MRYRTVSITTVTILFVAFILTSCLHEPTESDVIYSRSSNLHVYEPGNFIEYDVTGSRVKLVENVNGEAFVVEADLFGKITNCADPNSTIGNACTSSSEFTGKLKREWTNEIDLVTPLNLLGPIRVLEEIWTLTLDGSGEVFTSTRYISQVKTGQSQGQLTVHAYSTPIPGTYHWLNDIRAVDITVPNPSLQAPVNGIVMEPSPLESILGNSYVNDYDVLEGCDGQLACTPVAGIIRNSTYQYSAESLPTRYGTLDTYFIDETVNIIRPKDASAAINLGYDFETNCNTEGDATTDSPYRVDSATFSGHAYVFPDIGPLQMKVSCHYIYNVPYHKGGAVKLNGTNSSDVETASDLLTYTWTMISQPVGSKATVSADSTWAPTFTADVEGLYELSLTVFDGTSNSAQDKVFIKATRPLKFDSEGVPENRPPIANAGVNQNVLAGQVNLNASASSDADLDSLTYLWSPAPGNNAVLNDPTVVSPTFTATTGIYEFQLVVNDGVLDSAPDAVFISVISASGNQPPIANAGSNQNIVFGALEGVRTDTNMDYDAVILDTNLNVPTK